MQNAASGTGRVRQPVLPLLPAGARAIGPSAGLAEGPDGGVVFVFGLATFVYAAGDETGRREELRLGGLDDDLVTTFPRGSQRTASALNSGEYDCSLRCVDIYHSS